MAKNKKSAVIAETPARDFNQELVLLKWQLKRFLEEVVSVGQKVSQSFAEDLLKNPASSVQFGNNAVNFVKAVHGIQTFEPVLNEMKINTEFNLLEWAMRFTNEAIGGFLEGRQVRYSTSPMDNLIHQWHWENNGYWARRITELLRAIEGVERERIAAEQAKVNQA